MLGTKRITITSTSVVDDLEIAKFGAVIEGDSCKFFSDYKDQEACKTHRSVVRADQCEFEDYVYDLHAYLKGE